jgi:hypothetical protein
MKAPPEINENESAQNEALPPLQFSLFVYH